MADNYRIDGEEFESQRVFDVVCDQIRELTTTNRTLTERLRGIQVANTTLLNRTVATSIETQMVDMRPELVLELPAFCGSKDSESIMELIDTINSAAVLSNWKELQK